MYPEVVRSLSQSDLHDTSSGAFLMTSSFSIVKTTFVSKTGYNIYLTGLL